jgi:Skp family chaperone for outer membrane proteins
MTKAMTFLATAAALAVAAPATAQVNGIAVANPEAAVAKTRAWVTAKSQIETQYKTQLDQANARRQAAQTELQPLVSAYQTAARAPNASEASLRPQLQAIQTREQAAQQEIGRLTQPAQRAQAYAIEQISNQLRTAVDGAVAKKRVTLLLRPEAALFAQPAADITNDITAELDRLVPTVSITPPANWQPGQQQGAAAATTQQTPAPGR